MNRKTKVILRECKDGVTITDIVNKVGKNIPCTYQQVYYILKSHDKLDCLIKHKNRHAGRNRKPAGMSKQEYAFCVRWSKIIWALKQGGGKCVECGNSDPRTLVYHHKNGSKTLGIVKMLQSKQYSDEDIKREIKNCDLLCCNCHKIAHINSEYFSKHHEYIKQLMKP